VGWKIKGSIAISKREDQESLSLSEFIEVAEDYGLKISISGFSFSGFADITSYDEETGNLSALFHAEGLEEDIPVSGKVSGTTLTLNTFEIEHDFASGTVSKIEGSFDSSTSSVSGTFSFHLTESDLFSSYVGMKFKGNFTLSL